MKITSAVFVKGVMGDDAILEDGIPQIAFIGRSNAGKSSLINSLTGKSKLAITSSTPGRTKQLNVFKINNTHYFIDLPGYGYAKTGGKDLEKLNKLIVWYLLESKHTPRVVLLIDAEVGPTANDIETLKELERTGISPTCASCRKRFKATSYSPTHPRQKSGLRNLEQNF
jgi:GTP-binding protein